MVKYCQYGTCMSDSRKPNAPKMTNRYGEKVRFVHFPGKVRKREQARRWIHACRRPKSQLSFEKLTHQHYICSLHFVGENGPTDEFPDPVPATISQEQRGKLEKSFERLHKKKCETFQDKGQVEAGNVSIMDVDENVGLIDKSEETSIGKIDQKNECEIRPSQNTDFIEDVNVKKMFRNHFISIKLDDPMHYSVEETKKDKYHEESDIAMTMDMDIRKKEDAAVEALIAIGKIDQKNECEICPSQNTDFIEDVNEKKMFRNHFISIILDDPMHYTGIKSNDLLRAEILEKIFLKRNK
eukprot:gene1306-1446_t